MGAYRMARARKTAMTILRLLRVSKLKFGSSCMRGRFCACGEWVSRNNTGLGEGIIVMTTASSDRPDHSPTLTNYIVTD